MARVRFPFSTILRPSHGLGRAPDTRIYSFCTSSLSDTEKLIQDPSLLLPLGEQRDTLQEVARKVCEITRRRPRWEQTLISDFPSFDFSNPVFFRKLFKLQRNALLSLRFLNWTIAHYNVAPDVDSCSLVFDALVAAKAHIVAKSFLQSTGFRPQVGSLERYVRCVCRGGLVDDAIAGFLRLRELGALPSVRTWNSVMSCCLKARRTDIVWELYTEMMELGIVGDANARTVGYLIQAFCGDGNVLKGYELLKQVMGDGLIPQNATFNMVISRLCKEGNYERVSELLHMMISKNCAPDLYMYQEVINGLCKRRKQLYAYQIFNNLKDRGYFPDTVMYNTLIHGLCERGWLGDARKLWFEMIHKGLRPSVSTYDILIRGYLRNGNVKESGRLFYEMLGKGYGERTVAYKRMVTRLCLHGRVDEALSMFEEMSEKGIAPDNFTHDTLIRYMCRGHRLTECRDLFGKLLMQGFVPSTSSYDVLIGKLSEKGQMQEVKILWVDMHKRGLKPSTCTSNQITTESQIPSFHEGN